MSNPDSNLFLSYHLGALSEERRLDLESAFLSDPEALVNYLDFKRSFEGSTAIQFTSSYQLKTKLKQRLGALRKSPYFWPVGFSLACGVAVGFIALMLFVFRASHVHQTLPLTNSILFDSSSNTFQNSNYL